METVVIRVRMPLTGNLAKGSRVAMQGTLLDYSHLSPLKEVNLADTFPEVRLDVPRCGASLVHDPWIQRRSSLQPDPHSSYSSEKVSTKSSNWAADKGATRCCCAKRI